MCRLKHLKPNYIHFKTNGNKLQDRKTTSNSLRFRINQEIKFLYCKKQNLNIQLYRVHLICANYCNSVWQHIQDSTDSKLKEKMDTLYQKRNKLDTLTQHTQTAHDKTRNTYNPD